MLGLLSSTACGCGGVVFGFVVVLWGVVLVSCFANCYSALRYSVYIDCFVGWCMRIYLFVYLVGEIGVILL